MTREKPGVRADGACLEARIRIGDTELTFAESMTLRVAIALGNLPPMYERHLRRIERLIIDAAERDGIVEPGKEPS